MTATPPPESSTVKLSLAEWARLAVAIAVTIGTTVWGVRSAVASLQVDLTEIRTQQKAISIQQNQLTNQFQYLQQRVDGLHTSGGSRP